MDYARRSTRWPVGPSGELRRLLYRGFPRRLIVEALVLERGRDEVLRRLAHPFWFQSFGAVVASGFLELLGTAWQSGNRA